MKLEVKEIAKLSIKKNELLVITIPNNQDINTATEMLKNYFLEWEIKFPFIVIHDDIKMQVVTQEEG